MTDCQHLECNDWNNKALLRVARHCGYLNRFNIGLSLYPVKWPSTGPLQIVEWQTIERQNREQFLQDRHKPEPKPRASETWNIMPEYGLRLERRNGRILYKSVNKLKYFGNLSWIEIIQNCFLVSTFYDSKFFWLVARVPYVIQNFDFKHIARSMVSHQWFWRPPNRNVGNRKRPVFELYY